MHRIDCWINLLKQAEESPTGIIDGKDCRDLKNMLDELDTAIEHTTDKKLRKWYRNYFKEKYCWRN